MTFSLHSLGQSPHGGQETRRASAKPGAMTMHEASRTLVKSTPELWAECSDGQSLSRHLGAFGEIRITKLEPETAVAWEGDDVRGTVTLESSGWGTRVVLTATAHGSGQVAEAPPELADVGPPELMDEAAPELMDEAAPELMDGGQPEATIAAGVPAQSGPEPRRPGFLTRLLGFIRGSGAQAEPELPPAPAAASEPDPRRGPVPAGRVAPAQRVHAPELDALVGALESLGTAHKRPFSRS
jgi:hypothetical protein